MCGKRNGAFQSRRSCGAPGGSTGGSFLSLVLLVSLLAAGLAGWPGLSGATVLPLQSVDLEITDVYLDGFVIHYVFKNNGPGDLDGQTAPKGFRTTLSIDGKPVAQDLVEAVMPAGSQLDRTFDWQYAFSPPSDTISVLVDAGQDVTESNEGNNLWSAEWKDPASLPDLVVQGLEAGAGNKLVVTLGNIGKGPLPKGWIALGRIWLDGQNMGTFDMTAPTSETDGGIAMPGGLSIYVLGFGITKDTLVTCVADATKEIAESDETNNDLKKMVVPAATPTPKPSPTGKPTPTAGPSPTGTPSPTAGPTPGGTPTGAPTGKPTAEPSGTPTAMPTGTPTELPTPFPTATPTPSPGLRLAAPPTLFLSIRPTVSDITATGAVLTWTTGTASDSKVQFGTSAGKPDQTAQDKTLVLLHRIVLEGLAPDTTYQYIVSSGDGTGYQVRFGPLAFTTKPQAAPTPGKGSVRLDLPSSLSGRTALVTAIVEDMPTVRRVVFLVDGIPVRTDYSAPFQWPCDTTEFGEGSHSFGVRAFDAFGESVEAARSAPVRNQVAGALSPVQVRIVSPSGTDPLYGSVDLAAEIRHDLGLRIDRIEFRVDETLVSAVDLDPPADIRPILAPSHIVRYRWDASEAAYGSHVASVRVRDEAGNWGVASRRFGTAEPPPADLVVEREVVRNGPTFDVLFHIRNDGGQAVENLVVRDTAHGFQCAGRAEIRRGTYGGFEDQDPAPTVERLPGRTSDTAIGMQAGTLAGGASLTLRYHAVPVLADPYDASSLPRFGTGFGFSYDAGGGHVERNPPLVYGLSYAEYADATRSADYLAITCPPNLDLLNESAATDSLLARMADLARARNGVLGYVSAARAGLGALSVRELMRSGSWGDQMAEGWRDHGYLLLVGETDVLPAFTLRGIPLADSQYASMAGSEEPELRIGRLVGNTADKLEIPIDSSLAGVYRAEKGLLVSGPEDTWEPNVKYAAIGEIAMRIKGLETRLIHTEYWTSTYRALVEGIRIKNGPKRPVELWSLAEFLLRRMGPPEGPEPDEDLSGYSVEELAAWLLWARGLIDPATTLEEALGHAGDLVEAKGNGQGLNGTMWLILRNLTQVTETRLHLSLDEVTAWLLWEESAPRGPFSGSDLGTIQVDFYRLNVTDLTLREAVDNATAIAALGHLSLAVERAEVIQAENPTRGGTYAPWEYQYLINDYYAEQRRKEAVLVSTAEGQDIICFFGHGDPGGWCGVIGDWPLTASRMEEGEPDLGGRNPIVIAFACDTGNYRTVPREGYEALNPNPSISERFLESGAGAYLGAIIPMPYWQMDEMVSMLFWEYWSADRSIGETLQDLKDDLIRDPDWIKFIRYFNLYGDPAFGDPRYRGR